MVILKVLVGMSVLVSAAWVVVYPTFEPILAAIGSIVALLSLYIYDYGGRSNRQRQKVKGASQGLQAGGDIRIRVNDRDSSNE